MPERQTGAPRDNAREKPEMTTRDHKGRIVVALLRLLSILPAFARRFMVLLIARLSYWLPNSSKTIARKNLEFCLPHLSSEQQEQLLKKVLKENARLLLEFPLAWLGDRASIESRFSTVNNRQLIEKLRKSNKPLIIAVPHLGNWEFFWHWVQINYPAVGMYSPAKLPSVDNLMIKAREKFGGKGYATDAKGILGLMRAIKKGGVMMILPDQAPSLGAGTTTPFFNKAALTMTLLHKFIQKTDANLLFGSCIRNEREESFEINLFQPEFDIRLPAAEEFNLAMNRQLEKIILQSPAQYQWSYKRFKRQADGSNPYQ